MSYKIYKSKPLTSEMIRVMQDWYDGRDSMFFKVSIGETESKRITPSVSKHFTEIRREAFDVLREMTDEMASSHPDDVKALQDLLSWAHNQNTILRLRGVFEDTTIKAIKAGMTREEITSYIDNIICAQNLPVD